MSTIKDLIEGCFEVFSQYSRAHSEMVDISYLCLIELIVGKGMKKDD